ncbi:FAD-binding Berberine family protein [Forsythia ovata]|uniref:FAD-binding Berberine family protein n=1 Tax=Forsythia ovata TaxID=205694 RepID=A0ABD1RZT0_9LAMI
MGLNCNSVLMEGELMISQNQKFLFHIDQANIFMIQYGVGWEDNAEFQRHINWIRRLISVFLARYVSKSPRAAYFNYRDLDIGMNNIKGNTSYNQASVWGFKYFKNNFRRLIHVKNKVESIQFLQE